ncbi:tegument protein US24 [Aotine betaherpesvirus 1]|uniref:Tegument protein US24 n=1 Tax=Aotine betaherpesvirus 1 TaxID=50290 RepID=G8XUK9_9BETA|nr:tegument protein US24 [Aotine betaherpesvirus 1]AEV80851.1 tegument protein US24 [Aotine betaherpesvirus 1]
MQQEHPRPTNETLRVSLPRDTMELQQQVLKDFKDLFLCVTPVDVMEYVRLHRKELLCLGRPGRWYVLLKSDACTLDVKTRALRRLCCVEPLCLLGPAVVIINTGASRMTAVDYVVTPFLMFWGSCSRLYAYDTFQDTLLLVAHHLDELARYGVSQSEMAYRDSVHMAVRRATNGPYAPAKTSRSMHVLFLNSSTPDGTYATVERLCGSDVKLHTPGYGPRILRLVKTVSRLRAVWPFNTLTDQESERWWSNLKANIATPWYLLGVVGTPREGKPFQAEMLVLLDWFGAAYVVQMEDPSHHVRRVADSLTELFRMGLLKYYFRNRRFDEDSTMKTRLEFPSSCPHQEERGVRRMREILFNKNNTLDTEEQKRRQRRLLRQHYDWLCLKGRFDPTQGAWERRDPNTLVIHRFDCNSDTYVVDPHVTGLAEAERCATINAHDIGPRIHCLVATRSRQPESRRRVIPALVAQSRYITYSDPFPLKTLAGLRDPTVRFDE